MFKLIDGLRSDVLAIEAAGKITHVRDFMDTLGVAHAIGRMPFAKAS